MPALRQGQVVVSHTAYQLVYSEEHEQAVWVAYELTDPETRGPEERASGFYEDPAVSTGSATDADYAGSGFDRGHLAPAGDMTWSPKAMVESFYYSNMSPQQPSFNRGIWKKLETMVRAWGQQYESVFVVTGPVLEAGTPVIGPNKVSVPSYYYKVVFRQSGTDCKTIGFLMPNASSSEPILSFSVTIDEIERRTGIDFFYALPDELENRLESGFEPAAWNWTATLSAESSAADPKHHIEQHSVAPSAQEEHSGTSVQCAGTTKAGNRCQNRTTSPTGRCHLHQQ